MLNVICDVLQQHAEQLTNQCINYPEIIFFHIYETFHGLLRQCARSQNNRIWHCCTSLWAFDLLKRHQTAKYVTLLSKALLFQVSNVD